MDPLVRPEEDPELAPDDPLTAPELALLELLREPDEEPKLLDDPWVAPEPAPPDPLEEPAVAPAYAVELDPAPLDQPL